MRVGFATIYSWRPHVEHLYFLATLARKAGHQAFFLACDGDLPTCYTRELRDKPAWRECLECRIGGIRSYTSRNVSAIRQYSSASPQKVAVPPEWAHSSASTLGRFESDADYSGSDFATLADRLYPTIQLTYDSACAWIRETKLDAICVFNARIDATRAIFEAAKALGIHVVSLERTWFGDGLQLLPGENCLGLRSLHALVEEWRERPLTRAQGMRAAAHVARRFLRTNVSEWRAYNTNARIVPWPITAAKRRILLIPSSRNEVWGHPDWASAWSDPTEAYDALIARFGLDRTDVLLRCHPNWGELVGKRDGALPEKHYADWARRRDVLCIPSKDTTSTLGLIEECDAVVVAHGSAALDAGILGKQVIGTALSQYQQAGFRDPARNATELSSLRLNIDLPAQDREQLEREVARRALRFCYTIAYRMAQYTRFVKADATTRFRYDFGADAGRFIDLLRGGPLSADDATWAADPSGEDEVLELIRQRRWDALQPDSAGVSTDTTLRTLQRRLLLRPIDRIRRRKPLGDRLMMESQRS